MIMSFESKPRKLGCTKLSYFTLLKMGITYKYILYV